LSNRIVLLCVLSVAGGLCAAPAAPAKTTWLCRPGLAQNPCEPPLSVTVFDHYGGAGVVTHPARLKRRPVDCFYVYPTVSDQQGPNATRAIDPEVRSIALYQAARFSQVCRVYAPVYRQVTVAALSNGTLTAAVARKAYRDVVAAWKEYLARYNHGRGVVLIGHSQGAGHLQQLIQTRIDGKPVARRLVSAILLGGNVTVRKGRDTGGVFRHVPACRRRTELGCVVAFSSFGATPPEDAIFGRRSRRFASFFRQPSGRGYEVLCTNPGDLAGNRRTAYRSILPEAPFAPGTLIAAGISILGFQTPQASTTFIEGRGLFSGRCSRAGGANVLRIESGNGAPALNPSPDATWGLHLLDVNVAQRELILLVRSQGGRYARAR
jgi:Protein of unknown function (DUF3089)